MATISVMLMNKSDADFLTAQTASQLHMLSPRMIEAGPHAGRYSLLTRIKLNPLHARFSSLFDTLTVANVDPAVGWPPPADDGALQINIGINL